MNYKQAIDFLQEIRSYGSRPGLQTIQELMAELGNPQDRLKLIHIAGTNAKGTVGTMIAASFTEAGYQTGYFSSPPVYVYEEQFRMNGRLISHEELAGVFSEVREACDRMVHKGLRHPTKFEVETAAAFLWFYQSGVDLAVIETGMGGKLDATNLIEKPLVSVLAPIAIDHVAFLGDTLEKIAEQKAGIIKSGCPVVSFPQKPEAMKVIRWICREKQAELFIADTRHVQILKEDAWESRFAFRRAENTGKSEGTLSEPYRVPLPGFHNVENAVCSLAVLKLLKSQFPQLTEAAARRALESLHMPGRLERLDTKPCLLLDGGHNPAALRALRNTLDQFFSGQKTVYIMGVLADKDYRTDIAVMFPQTEKEPFEVFTVTPPNPRALEGEKLAEILTQEGCHAVSCGSFQMAVKQAAQAAGTEGMVVAFGSFTILGEIRRAWLQEEKMRGVQPEVN